jgi:hypothetical protein
MHQVITHRCQDHSVQTCSLTPLLLLLLLLLSLSPELAGRRPLFPPGIDLSPDEAEVIRTFR